MQKRFLFFGLLLMMLATSAGAAYQLTDDEYLVYTDALTNGELATVRRYLDLGLDINAAYFGWSGVQLAVSRRQLAVVQLLLERGADVNYVHPFTKMTAFHLAAYNDDELMLRYLANHGANINAKLNGDLSIVRAIRDEGKTKTLKLLLELGVKDDGCQKNCL